MAFLDRINEMTAVGAGELIGGVDGIVSTYKTFEDGIVVGRFAKLDAGSIDNIDGSVSPLVCGVVLRNVAGAVDGSSMVSVDVIEKGMVSVEVKAGVTPSKFDKVYIVAGTGEATTVATDNIAVDGYFYGEIKSGVWSIVLNKIA